MGGWSSLPRPRRRGSTCCARRRGAPRREVGCRRALGGGSRNPPAYAARAVSGSRRIALILEPDDRHHLIALGDTDEARRLFEQVSAGSQLASEAAVQVGRICASKGDWREALTWASRACASPQSSGNAPLLRAIALARDGQADQARDELLAVLRLLPLSLLAASEIARLAASDDAAPKETLARLLSVDPHYPIDLAVEYCAVGLPREAITVLRAAYARNPQPLTAHLRAHLAIEAGDERGAAGGRGAGGDPGAQAESGALRHHDAGARRP